MTTAQNEVFKYLDALRESSITNMYGSGPWLENEFGMDRYEARDTILEWMRTFTERHSRTPQDILREDAEAAL